MRWKADLTLLFVAVVWGTGFVAQRLATTQLGTFSYNSGRFLVAALVLFCLSRLQPGVSGDSSQHIERKHIPWMVLAGALLFAAAGLQQAGLYSTSIGNASFITGLYVVLVPLILMVVLHQRVSWLSWIAVGLAALGVMLLSLQGEVRLSPGDLLELVGALLWALHVILVGRLAGWGVNPLNFSIIQFITCGLLNLVLALGLEPRGVANLVAAWPVVLYSALFPIGLGFTLQIAGQKYAPAVDAAVILSMEAVFATLFGYLFLKEMLTAQQLAGCAFMLSAMILAQVRVKEPVAV